MIHKVANFMDPMQATPPKHAKGAYNLDLAIWAHKDWILDTYNGPKCAQDDDDEASLLNQHSRTSSSSSSNHQNTKMDPKSPRWIRFSFFLS